MTNLRGLRPPTLKEKQMSKELIQALILLLKHEKIDTVIEILEDELSKAKPTNNQRIVNSMKTMTWKTIK
jgi:hypothetical protein